MATTTRMTLGDYEVWIVVEGQEVEHYGIEVDEAASVATCWIASKEDQVTPDSLICVNILTLD